MSARRLLDALGTARQAVVSAQTRAKASAVPARRTPEPQSLRYAPRRARTGSEFAKLTKRSVCFSVVDLHRHQRFLAEHNTEPRRPQSGPGARTRESSARASACFFRRVFAARAAERSMPGLGACSSHASRCAVYVDPNEQGAAILLRRHAVLTGHQARQSLRQ
jgi:hypothetical protein